jgi:RecA-family ATPase
MASVNRDSAFAAPDPLVPLQDEQLLLGACLVGVGEMETMRDLVDERHFGIRGHGAIWAALLALHGKGEKINPVTLWRAMEPEPLLDELGGGQYVLDLHDQEAAYLVDPVALADSVRGAAGQRRIRDWLEENPDRTADGLEMLASELRDEFQAKSDTLEGGIDMADWGEGKAPIREFIVPGWIINKSAALLSGPEGAGKSLCAQQMATCTSLGLPFLGLETKRCPALYFTCEDGADELWRRQRDINRMLGVDMADVEGRVHLASRKGRFNNELGYFDRNGALQPAPLYYEIERYCLAHGIRMAFLDNAAHMFVGNENARHDVAAFLGLLERLSERINGSVILLAHPNKEHGRGNKQGNEYSGSTGWSAHVRSRLFLDFAKEGPEGQHMGSDGRVLRKSKSNYGKAGEEVYFRWHEWAFVLEEELAPDLRAELSAAALSAGQNEIFLKCLRARNEQKRYVSPNPGPNYAPSQFEGMPQARGLDRSELKRAMERLFNIGALKFEMVGRDTSKGRDLMGLVEMHGVGSGSDLNGSGEDEV